MIQNIGISIGNNTFLIQDWYSVGIAALLCQVLILVIVIQSNSFVNSPGSYWQTYWYK